MKATSVWAILVVASGSNPQPILGFAPIVTTRRNVPSSTRSVGPRQQPAAVSTLFSQIQDNSDKIERRESRFQIRRRLKRLLWRNPVVWGLLTTFPSLWLLPLAPPPAAHASAPIMAMPKGEELDPGKEAIKRHEKQLAKQAQIDLDEMAKQARRIERTKGSAARAQFEKQYQAQQAQRAQEKADGLIQLKRDLLKQGLDPYCDIEGQRQCILYDKGVDLAQVSGTPFSIEQMHQEKSPRKSFAAQKAPHRKVIQLMVQDLEARGEQDFLQYFETHKDQTMALLDLPGPQAVALVQEYQANLEEYGQITKPKPGEQSVKEKLAAAAVANPKTAAKAEKDRLRAEARAEKERVRAEQKAQRERAKAEKQAEKERLRAETQAAKDQAKAAAAAAAAGAAMAGSGASAVAETVAEAATTLTAPEAVAAEEATTDLGGAETAETAETASSEGGEITAEVPTPAEPENTTSKKTKAIDIVPASAVLAALGAGAYGFKVYQDRAAAEEEERQRQFRLLMDGSSNDSDSSKGDGDNTATLDPDLDVDTLTESSSSVSEPTVPAPVTPPPPTPTPPKKKSRRLGIFKSKKDGRETDLNNLVSPAAQAPEFAALLGKILTYGAPGRFPQSVSILKSDIVPGMETKFDLEQARQLLTDKREALGLDVSQSAEIFANVVNCMLIEIVDLASSSLKEKDQKIMVNAMNIVVDFLDHGANLYDAVASGVSITPVTYSGSLSRSKLEQMYSQYAVGGMMNADNMADDFDARVTLLRDVLGINEKKAEGLMLKAMQKNMMEMLKNGGEGMEDMMKGMGMDGLMGAGGMPGGPDGMPDMDIGQIKSMLLELKAAKDRGEISSAELAEVRQNFQQVFGANLDDLIAESKAAGQTVSDEDKEVLDLMKSVLG